MGWVFTALIVIVIAFIFLASAGRLGQMAPQTDDRPVPDLPTDRPLAASDLEHVRFAVVVRGYSMEQVDALLDRLAHQITPPAAEPEPRRALLEHPSAVPFDQTGPVPIGWPALP